MRDLRGTGACAWLQSAEETRLSPAGEGMAVVPSEHNAPRPVPVCCNPGCALSPSTHFTDGEPKAPKALSCCQAKSSHPLALWGVVLYTPVSFLQPVEGSKLAHSAHHSPEPRQALTIEHTCVSPHVHRPGSEASTCEHTELGAEHPRTPRTAMEAAGCQGHWESPPSRAHPEQLWRQQGTRDTGSPCPHGKPGTRT